MPTLTQPAAHSNRIAQQATRNPVRFTPWLVLLLTTILLFAEHYSPTQVHNGVTDRDVLTSQFNGQLPRQIAYVSLGLIGLTGLIALLQTTKSRPETTSRTSKSRLNRRLLIPLALLAGWASASLLWSDTPAITFKRLVVLSLMSLGATGLALTWTHTQVLQFIVWSAALQVTAGLLAELALGFFTPWHSDYRFAGTLTWNQQGYLDMALAVAGMALARTLAEAGQPAWTAWSARLLSAYGALFLLLTRSRGALIALAICLVLWFLLTLNAKARTLAVLLTASVACALLASGVGDRLYSTLNREGEGNQNLTGRAPLWQELLTYADRHLLLGYGYEGFWTTATIDDVSNHQHWQIDSAHSGYLESLLTLGLVGVTLHTLALLAGLAEGIRRYRRTRRLLFLLAAAFCAVYLIGGTLEAILLIKPSPISFYVAITLALLCLPESRERQPA